MQMPGLLVEYFISGSVALIWLLPLLGMLGFSLPQNSTILTLFIPGIYVAGMLVDFISGVITRPIKHRMQLEIYKTSHYKKYNKDDSHFSEIQSFLYVPELVKAIEMRRSRARIARSTTINLLAATMIATLHFWQSNNLSLLVISIALGVLLTYVGFAMWSRYYRLSEGFEVESMKALNEKLERDKGGLRKEKTVKKE